ncbi:MAG TPA: hypothetical protein VFG09_03550 [Thermodesulfovibrionales bacterium]|jgi:flagellar motility protein MotE (MotC chaperone)|nr:hypothetical protein [Thermodesulfovibrionales bacterium]
MTERVNQESMGCAFQTGIIALLLLIVTMSCFLFSGPGYGQDDVVRLVEKKQKELREKEEALKKEEERINALKKDVEEKIEKYTKLLTQLESTVKKIDQSRDEKLTHLVKVYEAMPPEDAAARISVLDENTAVRIMRMMKSKKAGAVMAAMEPRKVAAITRELSAGPGISH